MSEVTYKVTLPRTFTADQRIRAGVVVSKGAGYEGPLTEDQLKAIEADPELTVVASEEEAAPEAPKKKLKSASIK